MNKDKYFNFDKSIASHRLIYSYRKGFFDHFEFFLTIFYLVALAFSTLMFINYEIKIQTIPDKIFTLILFFFLILILYGIYKKFEENKLTVLSHSLTKIKLKKLIFESLSGLNQKNIIETDEIIIVEKVHSYYSKTFTFIITKDNLYFNIKNDFPKLNPPIVYSHIFLKLDLKKRIKEAGYIKN